MERIELRLDRHFFARPQELSLLADIHEPLVTLLTGVGFEAAQARATAERLPAYFTLALHESWRAKPAKYRCLEKLFADTPFAESMKRFRQWSQYGAWLLHSVNERMFHEAFGLWQVYVPLRAYYETPAVATQPGSTKTVVDLETELRDWLAAFDKDDAIRIVSGGPGSGKSTFCKIFAAKVATGREFTPVPTLLVPLHLIDPTKPLVEAVGDFAAQIRYLEGNPLLAGRGEQRLLLVFDGLDELVMQGRAAWDAAQAFVDEVIRVTDFQNAQGLMRQALLSGRDLAVQGSRGRLRDTRQILHLLPYYVYNKERGQFIDNQRLLAADQRQQWWRNYCRAVGSPGGPIPAALLASKLSDISNLTARRIVRMLEMLEKQLERRRTDPDDGWDERAALAYVAELCGPAALDFYLLGFIHDELAALGEHCLQRWQTMLCRLLNSAIKHALPMERFAGLVFQEQMRYARNAEEMLLALLYGCARVTGKLSKLAWPTPVSFGVWIARLQGQRSGAVSSVALACLGYLDLSGCQLLSHDFHAANLQGADLGNSDLGGANLEGADLRRARLWGADLSRAWLDDADLGKANLGKAKLIGASLRAGKLAGAVLAGADLNGADLTQAEVQQADLRGADLNGASLRAAKLHAAVLDGADLRAADLQEADFELALLANVDLRGAKLRDTVLAGAVLSGADLRGLDLSGAYLEGTDLRDADLSGAIPSVV